MTDTDKDIEAQIDDYIRKEAIEFRKSTIRFMKRCFIVLGVLAIPIGIFNLGIILGREDVTVVTDRVEIPVIQQVKIESHKGVSDVDIQDMALTIMYEARSESYVGQSAVGHVMKNRLEYDKSCTTIGEVVTEPYQFSVYNENDLNRVKIINHKLNPHKMSDRDSKEYAIAWKIAHDILTGLSKDPTDGATMYLNPKTVTKIPEWFKLCKNTKQIGQHHFCYYEAGFCKR